LGMISYTLSILFFASKPIVKKLLSIEIVIFIPLHSRKHNWKNISHRKLPRTNSLIDYETAFCSVLAVMVLEKKNFKD
jgi:hypothetical protein